MNIDDLGRDAAVTLLTRATDGLDVDAQLRELYARAEPSTVATRPRGRLVAAVLAFAAVALIVGAVVAVVLSVSGGSSGSGQPSTHIAPKDVVGYVPTAGLPRGFHATEMEKVDQPPQPGGTTFRNVVYLDHPARGGHFVAIIVSRNPFNGVLADQTPATGRRFPDPFSAKAGIAWTRAPYWEIQATGDVSPAVLQRFAEGVSVPDDATATVDAAMLPAAPKGFHAIYEGFSTTGITRLRSLTYSRAYGSSPAVSISSESPGFTLRNYTRLRVVRVQGREAILHRGHDVFGNVTYLLVFHESRDRDTTVGTVGLSLARLMTIAEHVRPVGDVRWANAARGARTSDPLLTPPALAPGAQDRGVTIASYPTPEDRLDAVLDTFTVHGFRWSCLKLRDQSGGATSACTDPATGFAFPTVIGATLTGATRFAKAVLGSVGAKVASVRVEQDGTPVPVTIYDTHTGAAPKLFVAFVTPDDARVRITTLDARGHVLQRARVEGGNSLLLSRG